MYPINKNLSIKNVALVQSEIDFSIQLWSPMSKCTQKTADVKKYFAIRSQASCNIDKQKIFFSVELQGLVEIKDGVKTGHPHCIVLT